MGHICDFSAGACKEIWSCEARRDRWFERIEQNGHAKWRDRSHVKLPPAEPSASPRLVLFLGGTGTFPGMYMRLLEAAARAGNYVLGLSHYWHPPPVSGFNSWCLKAESCHQCNHHVHRTVLGIDSDGYQCNDASGTSRNMWEVQPDDTVIAKLRLALSDPPWTEFLTDDGEIAWERIVVSGHSQGAVTQHTWLTTKTWTLCSSAVHRTSPMQRKLALGNGDSKQIEQESP